jgi:predicted alpha/beta hydrolase
MKKKIWAIATVFILIFTGLSESSISHASPKKSKSYQLGWNAVYKTSRPTLDSMGLEKIFGLNGKPIKAYAQGMCDYFLNNTNYRTSATNMKDWFTGCTNALMTLRSNY